MTTVDLAELVRGSKTHLALKKKVEDRWHDFTSMEKYEAYRIAAEELYDFETGFMF